MTENEATLEHEEIDVEDEEKPTNADISDAVRLARIYLYGGAEPYAPAIYSIATMLMVHRKEIEAKLSKNAEGRDG